MTHTPQETLAHPAAPPRKPRKPTASVAVKFAVTALIILTVVPFVGGLVRVIDLATGTPVPDSERFFDSPLPVLLHIVTSLVYLVLGAFQFVPRLRRTPWHRMSGRFLVVIGLVSSLSALWMTLFYDIPGNLAGPGLFWVRLVFALAMTWGLVYAVVSIRRGNVRTHKAWMIRAYAIGMGAGSQAVIFIVWQAIFGVPDLVVHTVLMTAGWIVNLVIGEVIIARGARRPGNADRPAVPAKVVVS